MRPGDRRLKGDTAMSDNIPLGYYVLFHQHFGDGGPSQATRVGPYADRQSADRFLTEVLRDPINKTDVKLVLRQEQDIVLGQSG